MDFDTCLAISVCICPGSRRLPDAVLKPAACEARDSHPFLDRMVHNHSPIYTIAI
jgi:hypothetical protein